MLADKIAVLGSNSFAGSAFVAEALCREHLVLGMSRSQEPDSVFLPYQSQNNFQFRQLDLNQNLSQIIEVLAEFKPEIIVDFAGQGMVAESWQAPEQWYQTNIVAKVKLHHWLKDQVWLKKYIRISTPEVYGSCDDLINETAHYSPSTPYAISHAAIDMSLRAFHKQYKFPVVIGRFANFYGEHQQLYRIIPKTILSILSRKKLPLQGGGKSVRAFIHAKDVAQGIFGMIRKGVLGEVYHFSPSYFLSIREVVEIICDQLKAKFEESIEIAPERPGKDQAYLMDSKKSKQELGWAPEVSFQEGIDSTVQWVSKNFETLSRRSWNYEHKS